MGQESQLLRMLEPMVRPVPAPPGSVPASRGQQPIETRSFDDLLAEIGTVEADDDMDPSDATQRSPAPPLGGGLDSVENASLRAMLGRAGHES